jgi:uncharacterized protein YbjT (DUF2867 family)
MRIVVLGATGNVGTAVLVVKLTDHRPASATSRAGRPPAERTRHTVALAQCNCVRLVRRVCSVSFDPSVRMSR